MLEACSLLPETVAKLELTIKNALDDLFPAMTLAVSHHNHLVLQGAWGTIDPETRQIPVTTQALFDLASVTKLFTTTAFLSLATEHRRRIATPLVEVVPEFGDVSPRSINGGQDPHSKKHLETPSKLVGQTVDPKTITFRHLLTHTSGLPPWRDVYTVAPVPSPPNQADELPRKDRWGRALERLCAYSLVGQPDTGVRYSDIGLMLLGEAVSRLNGTPGQLEAAIQTRVLDPAGITEVMFNPMRDKNIPIERIVPTENDPTWRKRRVWGEVHDENACGVGGVAGHAGLFGTATGVLKLGQVWLTSATETFNIAPDLGQQAIIEQTNNERRGLGWVLKSKSDSSAGNVFSMASYGHTGFTGTSLWIDPTRQLVVVLLTNRVYPGRYKPGIHPFRRKIHDIIAEAVS